MDKVLPTIPVSELRKRLTQVLPLLSTTPVLLMNRGSTAGVLVQVEQWNQTIDELRRLQRIMQYDQQFAEIKDGHYAELLPGAA